jgi:chemotaxis protein methyltransferase WspC
MVLAKITTLLSQTIGLDPDVFSATQIARSVKTRFAACNLPDMEGYWARLKNSHTELEELIELVIVPETWFFRDGKPFDLLKTYATSEWKRSPARPTLRLLSMPSSTGEEPYSMAIALLEAGLQPKQFEIDAIDISQRSLTKARSGIYTKNSFRGDAWRERSHYFEQTKRGYELCQSVRDMVNFQQGNVITASAIAPKQYDIIFCRNLLIYLKPEACSQVLASIDRLLIPEGLLFVGSSESGKVVANNYISVRQPFTFAYRKSEQSSHLKTPIVQVKPSSPRIVPRPEDTQTPANHSLSSNSDSLLDLQAVRKLADAGRLAEATMLCQSYLRDRPTSALAYVLLGELYQSDRQDELAEQCFQRAIYLEPNSHTALVHLALLKESQGDLAGANIIQQRIQRLPSGFHHKNLEAES